MTTKQNPGEYSLIIRKAYRTIYENIRYLDPMIHSYVITYNKKLDVVEILRNIRINDEIILQKNPVWPKIEDGCTDYHHRLVNNEDYPKTKSDERIILDTIRTNSSNIDTIPLVSKIIECQ
jgi:hypothetical protein